ncbi:MAG: hypothetical protein J6039_00790 [Alphaproteobacteria bacterium]|nr:hypothetical protein [Alphaproteobacteria bacterium]
MKLTVFTPIGKVLQEEVQKVRIPTLEGYYTLLPKHIDFASAMKVDIVSMLTKDNLQKFVACHNGVAVKKGDEVTITVQNAVVGESLDELEKVIDSDFKKTDEQRKELNIAMARLELGIIRGFTKLSKGETDGGV